MQIFVDAHRRSRRVALARPLHRWLWLGCFAWIGPQMAAQPPAIGDAQAIGTTEFVDRTGVLGPTDSEWANLLARSAAAAVRADSPPAAEPTLHIAALGSAHLAISGDSESRQRARAALRFLVRPGRAFATWSVLLEVDEEVMRTRLPAGITPIFEPSGAGGPGAWRVGSTPEDQRQLADLIDASRVLLSEAHSLRPAQRHSLRLGRWIDYCRDLHVDLGCNATDESIVPIFDSVFLGTRLQLALLPHPRDDRADATLWVRLHHTDLCEPIRDHVIEWVGARRRIQTVRARATRLEAVRAVAGRGCLLLAGAPILPTNWPAAPARRHVLVVSFRPAATAASPQSSASVPRRDNK